jgi:anti-anti-sigma factor
MKKQDYNSVTVVELQGEMDVDSIDQLHSTVSEIIADGKNGIVFDLQSVDFIDSAALEKLLWARDYCSENNCQMKLANLNSNCQKILELTRLQNEFDCYNEMAEAVHSYV